MIQSKWKTGAHRGCVSEHYQIQNDEESQNGLPAMFSIAEVERLDDSPDKGAGSVKLQTFNTPWDKGRIDM